MSRHVCGGFCDAADLVDGGQASWRAAVDNEWRRLVGRVTGFDSRRRAGTPQLVWLWGFVMRPAETVGVLPKRETSRRKL